MLHDHFTSTSSHYLACTRHPLANEESRLILCIAACDSMIQWMLFKTYAAWACQQVAVKVHSPKHCKSGSTAPHPALSLRAVHSEVCRNTAGCEKDDTCEELLSRVQWGQPPAAFAKMGMHSEFAE